MTTTEYTVRTPFKLGGRWHQQGARVMLTDAEAHAYAASLDDGPDAEAETPAEGRGDVVDEAAEGAGYETNEAAATSTRPVAAAKPKK